MRLFRKLNILAFMAALAAGPIGCGDDDNPMTDTDGGLDGSNNTSDGSNNTSDGSNNTPDGSNNTPDGSNSSCESGGETFSYFVSVLDIGQEDTEGEIAGLNIDGKDDTGSTVAYTNDEDGRPCQDRPDFTLPGGGAMGIDNSVGKLLTRIEDEFGDSFQLDLSTELANAIESGTLLLAVRIHNVDLDGEAFPQNDDCVNAEILRLDDTGWDGTAEPGQEFTIHPASYDKDTGEAIVRFLRAKIENGRLVGESVSTLPVEFDGAEEVVQLGLIDAQIEVNINGDTISGGLLGSRLEVAGLADEIIKYDPQELSKYKSILEQLLVTHADLNPVDPGTGAMCQRISMGMTYSGLGVTLVDPI